MNYLAHARLSFNIPEILAGNMISDFIKGKQQFLYPPMVQNGIQLHRAIDAFTDNHNATREMKEYFRPYYRLYAGAFCDVVFDHFLANDTTEFESGDALQQFANWVYTTLDNSNTPLPEPFKKMLPYMKSQNWLYNYSNRMGMQKSFDGLVRRSTYLNDSGPAFEVFNEYYSELELLYKSFFPEIKAFAAHQLQNIK